PGGAGRARDRGAARRVRRLRTGRRRAAGRQHAWRFSSRRARHGDRLFRTLRGRFTDSRTSMIDCRLLRAVPLLLVLLTSGCASYYGQLAQGQWQLLRDRQPLERVIADPATDPALQRRLALAGQARDFASARLGLPDNGSYRSYVELDRPFVVWNVFATEEFSVEPRQHCFPIAGCVAYRGYFRLGRARGAAALLAAEGLDTWVAPVDAYSTLGWFDDPLLSSMLRRDDARLAGVIFHELAHQQLYLPGDTAFNESYASFVEQEGLRQWLAL